MILDLAVLGNIDMNTAARFFKVSRKTLYAWTAEDPPCPRNADGSFDLYQVHKWLLSRVENRSHDADSISTEKKKWEIEKIKSQVDKIKDEVMRISLHEEIMASRAKSLNLFLTKTFLNVSVLLVMKSLDEVRTILNNAVRVAMDVYTGKSDGRDLAK